MSVLDTIKKTFSFEDEYEVYEEDMQTDETTKTAQDNVIKPSFFKRKEKEKNIEHQRESFQPLARTERPVDDGRQTLNIVKPERFDDAISIVEEIRSGQIVVINTTKMEIRTAQRLLDFVSGATFAMQGDIQEVMESIYIASPRGISVKNSARTESVVRNLFNFK